MSFRVHAFVLVEKYMCTFFSRWNLWLLTLVQKRHGLRLLLLVFRLCCQDAILLLPEKLYM